MNSMSIWLLTGFASLLLRLLLWTQRRSVSGSARLRHPAVYVFWHGEHQLLLPWARGERVVLLTSASRDGRMLSRLLAFLGVSTRTGSSTRGGLLALRTLERCLSRGQSVGIALDGPRGPRGVAKLGALILARRAGVALVGLRAEATRVWRFSSWDALELAKPFARVQLRVMAPLYLGAELTRAQLESIAQGLAERMKSGKASASLDSHGARRGAGGGRRGARESRRSY